jgi:HSP20 family molecular chaperone IbpA
MNTASQAAIARQSAAAERTRTPSTATPLVDVYESPDGLLLVADLPGATAESVHVHLEKGRLTIEAKRAPEPEGTPLQREHRPRDYFRAFEVPESVDGAKIDASFAAGVLTLRLPKSDVAKPRRIAVKAG